MSLIETESFFIETYPNLVLHIRIKDNINLKIIHIEEMRKAALNAIDFQKHKVIISADGFYSIEQGVREKASEGDFLEYVEKMAFVTDKLHNKLIANFFIKFNKPKVKSRVFSTMNDALAWVNK